MSKVTWLLAVMAVGAMGQASEPDGRGKVFERMFYGTQYYRAPTPLPEDWEVDLPRVASNNLDAIQIRVNWRNNERKEDVYTFDDVDALMDKAEQNGRQVIIKFLLECAPQYIFDKYGGTRIGHRGEKIPGASHGAFYTGGWLPCFTNPKVNERMCKFVRTLVARYRDRKSILCWHAWNEPRTRPVGECYCAECRRAFGRYLKGKFGTIERMNAFYGVAEESFDNIALPGMAHGFWDIYEFRKFKAQHCIYQNLKSVRDAVREVDSSRPVIAHSGYNAAFMWNLDDLVDDYYVSRALDGWGSSVLADPEMREYANRVELNRFYAYLRSVNPNGFAHEVYPGHGRFTLGYSTPEEMDYQLYAGAANGSKGFCFWQFRAERLGMEPDCAGFVDMDGSPRPVLGSLRDFGAELKRFQQDIVDFYPEVAPVAILFDFDSLLLSCIEDSADGPLYEFNISEDKLRYYPEAHKRFYRLLYDRDLHVDYVGTPHVEEVFRYKVVYVPHYSMLSAKVAEVLGDYVRSGGIVIADEGFGLRQPNTWINPYNVACGFMDSKMMKRRLQDARIQGQLELATTGYVASYRIKDAKVLARFATGDLAGEPAVQEVTVGKGRFVQLGFSLGFNALRHAEASFAVFKRLVEGCGVVKPRYADVARGLEERRLVKGDEQFLFLINYAKDHKSVEVDEKVLAVYGKGAYEGGKASIPPYGTLILRCQR